MTPASQAAAQAAGAELERDCRACGILAGLAIDQNHLIQRVTRATLRPGETLDVELVRDSISAMEEKLVELRAMFPTPNNLADYLLRYADIHGSASTLPSLRPITTPVRQYRSPEARG